MTAHGPLKVAHRVGLELGEHKIARSSLTEWRGGGPYMWVEPPATRP